MDALITPSAHLYGLSTSRLEKSLEGLDDAEARRRVGSESNPMIWILGHLTNTRCNLLAMLGSKIEHPWGDRFAKGSKVEDDSEFPPLAELLAKWKETTEALTRRLEELTDEELSAPAPRELPVPDKTIRGAINFLAFHEVYHVGQMGYLRKWLGKESIVG